MAQQLWSGKKNVLQYRCTVDDTMGEVQFLAKIKHRPIQYTLYIYFLPLAYVGIIQ